MKYTEGPWNWKSYQESEDVRGAFVYVTRPAQGGCCANPDICRVYSMDDDGEPGGEMEANAHLISAGPELLEACELSLRNVLSLLYLLPVDTDETTRASFRVWQETLSAAIAKAEGKE